MLGYADSIFDLGSEMLGRLKGQREGVLRLRIGSVATLSRNYQDNWLRPLLSDPTLCLTLESGLLDGLLDRLLHHQLDVVLANEAVPADPERPLHGVEPRVGGEVDDMAMLRLIARDSGWLALVPEVVVQDELESGRLVAVGVFAALQEHFYAITTPQRYRPPVLDLLMAGGH